MRNWLVYLKTPVWDAEPLETEELDAVMALVGAEVILKGGTCR
jgi:hypothetical protein